MYCKMKIMLTTPSDNHDVRLPEISVRYAAMGQNTYKNILRQVGNV